MSVAIAFGKTIAAAAAEGRFRDIIEAYNTSIGELRVIYKGLRACRAAAICASLGSVILSNLIKTRNSYVVAKKRVLIRGTRLTCSASFLGPSQFWVCPLKG